MYKYRHDSFQNFLMETTSTDATSPVPRNTYHHQASAMPSERHPANASHPPPRRKRRGWEALLLQALLYKAAAASKSGQQGAGSQTPSTGLALQRQYRGRGWCTLRNETHNSHVHAVLSTGQQTMAARWKHTPIAKERRGRKAWHSTHTNTGLYTRHAETGDARHPNLASCCCANSTPATKLGAKATKRARSS